MRVLIAWTFCMFLAESPLTTAADDSLNLSVQLSAHCLDCHNSETTEGELDLTNLTAGSGVTPQNAPVLENMLKRVMAAEMPPADFGSLPGSDQDVLIRSLNKELDHLAERFRDDPGQIAMARLTPYEYRNVIRDLSGGIVSSGGRWMPNEGGAGEGFANVGEAQVMTPQQYEKYLDAAKDTLRHLRVYPCSEFNMVWTAYPRSPVLRSESARKELTDEVIAWFVAQQQKWGEEHRDELERQLGFVHAAYLEAAWHYHHRDNPQAEITSFATVIGAEANAPEIALAPVALKKWWRILNSDDPKSPHAAWATAWRALANEQDLSDAELRKRCLSIVTGDDVVVEAEDFAPLYEISFHEAKEEVLAAAEQQGRWPFRIDIGDAQELFLTVTDAGDGNRGEYAVWSKGRFVFRDGTSQPWQDVIKLLGANSGKAYPFGVDGEGANVLAADALGVRPPGALKFVVPQGANVFEVDLTLDSNRTKQVSIQALVLKQKPKSQSYIPGRYVFGGKKTTCHSTGATEERAGASAPQAEFG